MDTFNIWFDGVSDFSQVFSQLLTTVLGTLKSRIMSFENFRFETGADPLINTLFKIIPDEIHINDNIYILGGINRDFVMVENEYLSIGLDLSI
jgi:hypothetical protein